MTTKTSNPLPPFASAYSAVKNVFLSLSVLSVLSVVQPAFAQTGNLEVDGSLKVNQGVTTLGRAELRGNDLWIGRWADNSAAGLALTYTDGAPQGKPDTNVWYNHHWSAEWSLQHGSPVGAVTSLNLSSDHQLKLFPSLWEVGVNPTIILNPNGTGSITISGKKVLLEGSNGLNSNVTGYISYAFGESNSVSGYYSTAFGYGNNLQGNVSTTFGSGNLTQGHASLAVGQTNQSIGYASATIGLSNEAQADQSVSFGLRNKSKGIYSFTSGYENIANGQSALSLGQLNNVNGNFCVALGVGNNVSGVSGHAYGYGCEVTGHRAQAFGWYTKAQGLNQFVIGSGNIPSGSTTTQAPTDALFIIGNAVNANPSNAFLVRWNGDTTVYGNLESTKKVSANDIDVTNLKATGLVTISPQGDLSMGEFTAGGQ